MKNYSRATDKRIDHLLALIKSKDERIEQLEAKVNDLEQNSKKKNIIVTGLNTIQYNTIQTCLFFNHTVHCIIAIIIQFDQKRGGQKK